MQLTDIIATATEPDLLMNIESIADGRNQCIFMTHVMIFMRALTRIGVSAGLCRGLLLSSDLACQLLRGTLQASQSAKLNIQK